MSSMNRPSTETRKRKRNRRNQGATVSRHVTQLLTCPKPWVPLLALHKPGVVTPVVETEASEVQLNNKLEVHLGYMRP